MEMQDATEHSNLLEIVDKWYGMFGAAILDRRLHRAVRVNLTGASM